MARKFVLKEKKVTKMNNGLVIWLPIEYIRNEEIDSDEVFTKIVFYRREKPHGA